MAKTLTLVDEYGIILQALKILPNEFKVSFLESLAELEDAECHRTRKFPKTRLHKVKAIKQVIYRADIDKISGWRVHVQYVNGQIHLKDIIEGKKHDDVLDIIKFKKSRYQ
ncbi:MULTISPECIES: hypothetical protein [unclassified Synechocystis]|uniref:hypothetical protein n=1 Tax=unclassified Synechocystis TaxID=2640012 RepID=UPI0004132ECA|nr:MULTISPECIES: hypothetical protein [unclassified Synechocystis]AIE74474.1 hypothetical protein D082_19460 [Synechocystis sp. PCC 6714]MCT0254763.1 hypothetical protein [Synechocystis sp. CS-94]